MLDDEITLTFTAENLTDEDVTYDDITLYVFTDNYEDQDGVNVITDSVPLEFTSDAGESYTIPANGMEEITIHIKLDENQTAENFRVFTNGFFVDGYVVLGTADNSITKSSMPFTGFYGDWTSFDAMTPSYFEEGSTGDEDSGGLVDSGSGELLGRNLILNRMIESGEASETEYSEYESQIFAGYSPNGDGNRDSADIDIYMRRSLSDVTIAIYDSSGNVINETAYKTGLCRCEGGIYTISAEEVFPNGGCLTDGDYTLTLSGTLVYDSPRSKTEEKIFKFYVGTAAPEIRNTRICEENGRTYAAFSASDNRHLMGVQVFEGDTGFAAEPVKAVQNADFVFDVKVKG